MPQWFYTHKVNVYLSEFIGTLMLVFVACGSYCVATLYSGTINHAGISAAFGLIVMVMIYSFGNVSGAHFNPAVTVGFFMAKRLKAKDILPYIFAQFSGGIGGALLLLLFFPGLEDYCTTIPSVELVRAFLFEAFFSFILMLVILNISTGHMEKGVMAGVAVGATVFLMAFVGGPLTGASMNPARSLGPAIVSLRFESLWIYLSAPFVGTIAAAPLCSVIQGDQCCPPEKQ